MYSEQNVLQSRGRCTVPEDNQKNENIKQHGCCKLDTYDWLEDINFIGDKRRFDIVEVRFKNNRKDFFRSPEDEIFRTGDIVAVEASPGHDIGIVSLSGEIVRLQLKKKQVDYKTAFFKKIYRKARTTDIEKWTLAASREVTTMIQTRRAVNELNLQMKINDVEYQGDNTKCVFYYTAEGRVDFRELIKILADTFNVRIEMKQIGVRQESSRLGGIGSCGRELCCSSWLTNFKSVSTTAARTQQLSMNPQKLAGQCGKLKCCLNFEYDNYKEETNKFPPTHINLKTKIGDAFFRKMDILSGMMWYSLISNPSQYIPLKREDVLNIQNMNHKGEMPETFDDYSEFKEAEISYDNVIGQDDLNRFDNLEKNNRNKNNRNKSGQKKREFTPRSGQPKSSQEAKEGVKKPFEKQKEGLNRPNQNQRNSPRPNKPKTAKASNRPADATKQLVTGDIQQPKQKHKPKKRPKNNQNKPKPTES